MIFVGEEEGLLQREAPPEVPSLPQPISFPENSPQIETLEVPKRALFSKSLPTFRVSEVKLKKEVLFFRRNFPSLPALPAEGEEGGKSASGVPAKGGEDYFSLVRRLLEQAKTYPLKARLAGYEGKVGISFTILPDGRIAEIKILAPSPYEVLNRAAWETVKKISPLPPPPESLSPPLRIRLTITYRLD